MTVREPLVLLQERAAAAPPARLIPQPPLQVPFSGERAGDGPLTLGQISTLGWVTNVSFYTRMIEWPLALPAGITLADVGAALAVLLARHESLRTCYPEPAAGGERCQRVLRSGEATVDVYECADDAVETAALTVELTRRLRAREFDVTTDLPVRMAVATSRGVPQAAVLLYSHMAVDFASMALIDRQFGQLASGAEPREPGPLGHQPLDQAAEERSPRGRRRAAAALRSWEAHLRAMPQCLYAVPSADPAHSGGFASGWLWSPAAALALPHIVARTGASPQLAVFATLCVVLARRTGHDGCTMPAPASNRYQERLRGYVGTLAQDCIMSVDVRADGLDEVVRRAAAATLRSNRNGLVEIAGLDRVIHQVERDRGMVYARYCVFNDLSVYLEDPAARPGRPAGDPAEARRLLPSSRFGFFAPPPVEELLLFMLHQVEGEMILGAITRDANRVPRTEIETLLHAVELLLVEAASGDVDLSWVAEITGIQPVERGPGWLRTGGSWVDLAEVQRLLADALPGPARVFAVPGPDGQPELAAWLAAGPDLRTPEQAHEACLRVLTSGQGLEPPGGIRYTAMTPARYVVCTVAPAGQDDLAAWRRQPVLADGSGRAS